MPNVKMDAYQAVASCLDRTLLTWANRGGVQDLDLSKLASREDQSRHKRLFETSFIVLDELN